jgi:hypothetical protein
VTPREEPDLGPLRRELSKAGGEVRRLRDFLETHGGDRVALLSLLRHPVPVRLLEVVATTPPWSGDPLLLGAVVLNPRTPRALSLRLVGVLFWRDLAEVAATLQLPAAVRMRAETLLQEQLPDLRLGDRIALARRATGRVTQALLEDIDRRVLEACLDNPRLREADVLTAVRRDAARPILLEMVGAHRRWSGRYAVRLELVRQPRTPLGVALAQISSLNAGDLRELAEDPNILPLLQVAAARVAGSKPR